MNNLPVEMSSNVMSYKCGQPEYVKIKTIPKSSIENNTDHLQNDNTGTTNNMRIHKGQWQETAPFGICNIESIIKNQRNQKN